MVGMSDWKTVYLREHSLDFPLVQLMVLHLVEEKVEEKVEHLEKRTAIKWDFLMGAWRGLKRAESRAA